MAGGVVDGPEADNFGYAQAVVVVRKNVVLRRGITLRYHWPMPRIAARPGDATRMAFSNTARFPPYKAVAVSTQQ